MAQYQARVDIEDAKMINGEAELVNSLMQYEHHAESSHRGSVTGRSFVQCDKEAIQAIYGATYLCKPNREDLKRLLRKWRSYRGARKGGRPSGRRKSPLRVRIPPLQSSKLAEFKVDYIFFWNVLPYKFCPSPQHFLASPLPGIIGSLDCMHWEWKNCPTPWVGQFKGCHYKSTIVLEAVVSYDTWIWHAFFDVPRSNNDINVLWSSPLFDDVVNGWAPEFRYKRQESYMKDVERAFGILQAR
ncbi:unnamed protein product [Malus baccata var. baccata]